MQLVHPFAVLFAACLVVPAVALCGQSDGAWTVRPEMRLPPVNVADAPAVGTVARHDFADGLDGWRPRHADVKLTHAPAAGDMDGGMRVRGSEPSNWNFASSPRMQVRPGRKYRAHARVRIESEPRLSRPLFFKIEFVYDRAGAGAAKSGRVSSTSVPPKRTGAWADLTVEFEAPTGCRAVWAAFEKGTSSPTSVDVTVDAFVLDEIEMFRRERELTAGRLVGPITRRLRGVHPRIYLTAARVESLRASASDPRWEPVHKTLYAIADRGVRWGAPDYAQKERAAGKRGSHEQLWQRGVGNMIPHLALAYLMSGRAKYLESAKQWVFASLSYETWGLGRIDGLDLAAGHQLTGIGLAYDWLYHDLSEDERARIRAGLTARAGHMARAALTGGVWWHKSYMQNHQWVNCAGMATAGFAICDEVDEARGWIRVAHEKFLTTLATVGDDGASHEGYGYWEYGAEYVMRYMEMAHDLLGVDLYRSGRVDHPWLVRGPLYAVHLATPRAGWTRSQSAIDIGDCPRSHWYGPSYHLRNLARRYPASPHAGVAQWLATQLQDSGVDATSSGHYLNLCWYDPRIPERAPSYLPTMHHFDDIDIVTMRSGWDGRESLLVAKCGPPLGHRHIDAPYDYGAGHVHPDAGHFTFVNRGKFLVVDEGYSHHKTTADHNTVLIDGRGQKGEGKTWFDFGPWMRDRRAPRISRAITTTTSDLVECDVAPAYPPELGLETFRRMIRLEKPDIIAVEDELRARRPVDFEWRIHLEGELEKVSRSHYRLRNGDVVLEIGIERPAGHRVSTGKRGRHAFLSLRPDGKSDEARFGVVMWARAADDPTAWNAKLREIRSRLRRPLR